MSMYMKYQLLNYVVRYPESICFQIRNGVGVGFDVAHVICRRPSIVCTVFCFLGYDVLVQSIEAGRQTEVVFCS